MNPFASTFAKQCLKKHLSDRGMEVLKKIKQAEENRNSILLVQLAAEFRALDEEWKELGERAEV